MSVPVGVLISGSGTNLQALIDASGDAFHVAVVVSNRPTAYGLERARAAGIPTEVVLYRDHGSRESFDAALVEALRAHDVRWVCLAGFMRLVTPVFLGAFPWRVLNIHPALLPAFPGLHAQKQALDHGVAVTGATVHLVDAGTDTGPIVAQAAVPVRDSDDEDALKARILDKEHQLYPMVVRWAAQGRLSVAEGRVVVDLPRGEERFVL